MGLFDKKTCDVCSEKIGLLGNRKLEDGNMCSKCAKKLSPFTTDRRKTTLSEIKEHLAYREANKSAVAAFRVTRSLGGWTKVLIDDGAGKFIVTKSDRWQNENPDVISLSQIRSCRSNIEESRTEIMKKDKDGKTVSYFPRQYKVELDYIITIDVDSPFFSEIEFKLNFSRVDSTSTECRGLEHQLFEIKQALQNARPAAQPAAGQYAPPPAAAPAAGQYAPPPAAQPAAGQYAPPPAAAPAGPRVCPGCGAAAASATGKFCESCGGALQ